MIKLICLFKILVGSRICWRIYVCVCSYIYIYIYILNPSVNLDVFGPSSAVEDVNRLTTDTDDLFIAVKVCIEPTKLFG